jgi:glycosyltransferase involved in cell wall biosynthesis
MRIGIVVPHIFMHRDILPHVIFSPATLALDLADGLQQLGETVTLFSPGPVNTAPGVQSITADLHLFEQELAGRGDTYTDLLKKHPMTFVSLARQVQAELIAKAFAMANSGELDIVHIYTNEEDIALPFAALCNKPVVFTHHDPFNFLVKYKNTFPKYKHLNWISISMAQRHGMPADTNWVGNVYHGMDARTFSPVYTPTGGYIAYIGRIIEPKGVHLAIAAVRTYNQTATTPLQLRIAGKHYSGTKDTYWQERVAPEIDGETIIYDGFIGDVAAKQQFIANAEAVLVPSLFAEPFGMVAIESLACGTPVIGLASGALPEIIKDGETGYVVAKSDDETAMASGMAQAIQKRGDINRRACRADFEARFTSERMCADYQSIYKKLTS